MVAQDPHLTLTIVAYVVTTATVVAGILLAKARPAAARATSKAPKVVHAAARPVDPLTELGRRPTSY